MYLLLLVLDPGGGAVGDPFLTIGLSIAVAVLAIPTVLKIWCDRHTTQCSHQVVISHPITLV